jgi:hypothetical protein
MPPHVLGKYNTFSYIHHRWYCNGKPSVVVESSILIFGDYIHPSSLIDVAYLGFLQCLSM